MPESSSPTTEKCGVCHGSGRAATRLADYKPGHHGKPSEWIYEYGPCLCVKPTERNVDRNTGLPLKHKPWLVNE